MVKILSIDTAHSSSNIQMDKYGKEVIEHVFASNRELVETIMDQLDLFSAMRLINEINSLNGYEAISRYDVKEIKNYYRNSSVISNCEYNRVRDKNEKAVSESSDFIFYKSKCVSYRINSQDSNIIFEKSNSDTSRIFPNKNVKKEIVSVQSLISGDEKSKSSLSNLQKAYAEMGLM